MAACGASSDPPPDARQGDPDTLVGAFAVQLVAAVPEMGPTPARPGYTSVLGTIYDLPQPSPVLFRVAATDGPCQLLVPDPPFCTTPCGTTAVCVAPDTCQPYATRQSVGTVHARGISTTTGATEFAMEPVVNNYQPPLDITLAYPGFAEGTTIELAADGSEFTGGFTLAATGIDELALAPGEIALEPDQPEIVIWTAGSGAATVHVKLDISHHGGTNGKIECDGPDSGSLTITAPLMTQLLELGAAGFPTIIVSRQVTGSTVIGAGRVDLYISSDVERAVTVPGIESCNDNDDCTPPETCQSDLTCG